MFIPVLMLFLLGLGVPIFSLILGFTADKTPGWAWLAIIVISLAAIVGGVVIYVVARLQKKPEE
jgi:membrane protein DedA with SNARE-associated domain